MSKSVFVIGQKFWAGRLTEVLSQYGSPGLHVTALQVRGGIAGLRKWARVFGADVFFRVGLRPGSSTLRGRAFDLLWSVLRILTPKAKTIYYWIGTDVSQTLAAMHAGTISPRTVRDLRRSLHVADAQWLADELSSLGIRATVQRLPGALTQPQTLDPLPGTFRVMTYIPDARYRFYGGLELFEAARQLPGVTFDVVGGAGSWIPHSLPNLVFHGWQKDLTAFYRKSTVVVRLVEHDGMGATAVEALLFGRYVLYSYPLPHSTLIPFGDAARLIESLRSFYVRHQEGTLGVNTTGQSWAAATFDPEAEGHHLADLALTAAAGSTLAKLAS